MGTVATITSGTTTGAQAAASINPVISAQNTIGNYSLVTTTAISGTAASPTAIPFDSNDFQQGLLTHSISTNNTRFTVSAAQNYVFTAQLQINHLTTGTAPCIAWFRKNGTTEIANSAARVLSNGVANTSVLVVMCNIPMIATDYVELMTLSTVASEWNVLATAASGTSPAVVPVTPAVIMTVIALPA